MLLLTLSEFSCFRDLYIDNEGCKGQTINKEGQNGTAKASWGKVILFLSDFVPDQCFLNYLVILILACNVSFKFDCWSEILKDILVSFVTLVWVFVVNASVMSMFLFFSSERLESERQHLRLIRVAWHWPRKQNWTKKILTNQRGLLVPSLFFCNFLLLSNGLVYLSLGKFLAQRLTKNVQWYYCREEFRKTYKEQHPNVKAVSAVSI
jgi:hypothetical protein